MAGRYAEIYEVVSGMFTEANTWAASDVKDRLEAKGINGDPGLIKRARRQLGIGYFMEYGYDGQLIRWVWTTKGKVTDDGWAHPSQRYPDGKLYKGPKRRVA